MELDEFKIIIRQRPGYPWMENVLTAEQINVRKQGFSVISKIKRSLQLEMVLAVLFTFPSSLIIYRIHHFHLELFAWIMAAGCLCFTFYIIHLYRQIVHFQQTTSSVKKTLEKTIYILEQFTRLYFLLTLIMVPIILAAAILSGFAGLHATALTSLKAFSREQLIVLTIICIAWYAAMYFFTKWYISKLYGRHVTTLKMQLRELEGE